MDDHVQLIQLARTGSNGGGSVDPPLEVMVTGDKTRIALPSGVDGRDNFVVGLAIDNSVDMVSAPHMQCRFNNVGVHIFTSKSPGFYNRSLLLPNLP
jgi:hypothetical protein